MSKIILLACLLAGAARAEDRASDRPTILSMELGGRGAVQFDAEHYLGKYVGLGAGIEVMPGYFCLWGMCPPTLVHVPLFVSVRPMGDANGTYLSAGVSLWRAFGQPGNGQRVDSFLHLKSGEGALVATFEAGYEWRVFPPSPAGPPP